MSELIKRAHEYAESVFVSHLDLEKEDPDGEVSIKNMRSMAYYEGSLQTLDAFVAELERGIDEQIETFERTAMSCQGSYVATQQFSFLEQSEDFQTKADTLKEFKLKIQQTAKRMKGDV